MPDWRDVRVVEAIEICYRINLTLLPPDSPTSICGESCLNTLEEKLSRKQQGLLF